jgi:hypothetical protein
MQSFDLETHLTQPGLLTPPIVCGSIAGESPGSERILPPDEALAVFRELLTGDDVITGANVAYDMGCSSAADPTLLPIIFKAYAENRVYDLLIGQTLDSIAKGYLHKEGIWDPTTRGWLCDARGRKTNRYSLFTCVRLNLGRTDAKANDFWRLRYAMLENVPLTQWPVDAVQYPKDDVRNGVDVTLYQLANLENLHNMREQAETAFALHLGAIWGLRTDQTRYDALSSKVDEIHDVYTARFQKVGWIKPDGTENSSAVKRAIATAYGATGVCARCNGSGRVRPVKVTACRGPKVKNRYAGCGGPSCKTCGGRGTIDALGNEIICRVVEGTGCDGTGLDLSTAPALPRADKGGVKTDRDALMESGDEELFEYGANESEKIHTTYLPWLTGGLSHPINLKPDVLKATGRTSYDMIQQFPRVSALGNHGCAGSSCEWCKGIGVVGKKSDPCPGSPIWGPRACIRARPGRVFCSVDYSAIELCTLAQVCLYTVGGSHMADKINASKDPGRLHTAFAAQMIGLSEDEMVRRVKDGDKKAKDYRQAAKCFHPDTEVLTRNGWRRIADVTYGDEVAACRPCDEKAVEIVWQKPTKLTRRDAGELVHLENEGIDLRVTPDHRMLGFKTNGEWVVTTPEEFGKGRVRGWKNAGTWNGGSREVDERILRLAVAVQADGYVTGRRYAFNLKKIRKIDRLRGHLDPSEYVLKPTGKSASRITLCRETSALIAELLTPGKTIPWWWLELTTYLRWAALEEVEFWDGHRGPKSQAYTYSSGVRENIDVVQALASITDRKTRVKRVKSVWRLTVRRNSHTRGGLVKKRLAPYSGEVFCISVPESFILVRDRGVPVIVGQCANFGFPGGMGSAKLVLTKRKKSEGETKNDDGRKYAGIRFCILLGGKRECGTEKITTWKNRTYPPVCKACVEIVEHTLKPAWFAAWPEMRHYFEWVKKQIDQYGWVPCFGPQDENGKPTIERVRGGVDFTNGANNGFQALAGDGGKAAFRALVREAYLDESSPLFGARFPLWLHDESIAELWRHNAHIAGPRQAVVMVREMRRYTPNVWVVAEPALMEYWYKEAEPVYDADGRLTLWEPQT